MLGPHGEVDDPFNGTLAAYRTCAAGLRDWARLIVSELAAGAASVPLCH